MVMRENTFSLGVSMPLERHHVTASSVERQIRRVPRKGLEGGKIAAYSSLRNRIHVKECARGSHGRLTGANTSTNGTHDKS